MSADGVLSPLEAPVEITPYRVTGVAETITVEVLDEDVRATWLRNELSGCSYQPRHVEVRLSRDTETDPWTCEHVAVLGVLWGDDRFKLSNDDPFGENFGRHYQDGPSWLPPLVQDIVKTRNGATS